MDLALGLSTTPKMQASSGSSSAWVNTQQRRRTEVTGGNQRIRRGEAKKKLLHINDPKQEKRWPCIQRGAMELLFLSVSELFSLYSKFF